MNKPLESALNQLWAARQYLDDVDDEVQSIFRQIEKNGDRLDTAEGRAEVDKAERRINDLLVLLLFASNALEYAVENVKWGREEG